MFSDDFKAAPADAVRPWQHVLEPLSGYLTLAEKSTTEGPVYAEGWNFGPVDEDAKPVQWIVEQLTAQWGERQLATRWQPTASRSQLPQARLLQSTRQTGLETALESANYAGKNS